MLTGPTPVRVTRLGNLFVFDGEGWERREDSTIQGAIAGIAGLSATTTQANNLRGQITVESGQTSGAFTFFTDEPDAAYFLAVTAVASTGTPVNASKRVVSVEKRTNGFPLYVEQDPTNGTVIFDWLLLR